MKYNLLGLAFLLLVPQNAKCRVFTRCELAQELKRQGFPGDQLSNWVCLVESESGRNTGAVGKPNSDGSVDHGLFQINDRYWCDRIKAGKDCNVKCSDLLTDDITKASNCAKKIYTRHGFKAWYGWQAKCQKALPDLSSCGV